MSDQPSMARVELSSFRRVFGILKFMQLIMGFIHLLVGLMETLCFISELLMVYSMKKSVRSQSVSSFS